MDLTGWASLGTLAAGFASVGSLVAVAWQLRALTQQTRETAKQAEASVEATRASVYLTLETMMIEIDRFLLERPDLRRHLYGAAGNGPDDLRDQQVQAVSEMFIDLVDCVVQNQRHLPGEVRASWKVYFEEIMMHSEALQEFWSRHREWYDSAVHDLLGPAFARATSAKSESATSNRTSAEDLVRQVPSELQID